MGLDISDHGFAEARQEADQATILHLMACVEGDAQQIAFRDNHYEVVIMLK